MRYARTGVFTDEPFYECKHEWPADCFVQGGNGGHCEGGAVAVPESVTRGNGVTFESVRPPQNFHGGAVGRLGWLTNDYCPPGRGIIGVLEREKNQVFGRVERVGGHNAAQPPHHTSQPISAQAVTPRSRRVKPVHDAAVEFHPKGLGRWINNNVHGSSLPLRAAVLSCITLYYSVCCQKVNEYF